MQLADFDPQIAQRIVFLDVVERLAAGESADSVDAVPQDHGGKSTRKREVFGDMHDVNCPFCGSELKIEDDFDVNEELDFDE